MIGGKVIETLVSGDRVWINCQDYSKIENRMRRDTCAIFVENTSRARSVSEGDIVWWQSDRAMWTAKDKNGKTVGKPDTVLKRIGYSGAKRP